MVDVQNNRLEVEWRAHGRNGESWGLDHVVLDGNTKDPDIWRKQLCKELQRKFKHAHGGTVGLSMGLIDGGWASEYVFAFLQWLAANPVEGVTGKVRASKGIGQYGHPIIERQWRTIAKNLKGYHLGTWEAKELVNQRLRMSPDAEGKCPDGFMHYNMRYDEQYFRQLCTGIPTLVFEKVKGKVEEVRKFLNTAHFKDEGLDLAVGNLAAFRLRQWNFDAIEATIIESAAALYAEPKAPKTKERRSFIGWE
jgi:phage terminase large subunit GpA-like protein